MRQKRTPERTSWMRMHERCRGTVNAEARKNYLERGIAVCERWHSFDNFLADMGPRPAGTWLERNDNDLGYSPSNCRWATPTEQQRNRRSNALIEFAGRTQCLAAWAAETGIHRATITNRLSRGWSAKRALTQPTNKDC